MVGIFFLWGTSDSPTYIGILGQKYRNKPVGIRVYFITIFAVTKLL